MSMKISKEVRVGIVAIIALFILVWGYNYLKGSNLFNQSKTVYTIFPKVPGLADSSPIFVNGVQLGIVQSAKFHPNMSGDIIVELLISNSGLLIPKNSVANLISLDFLGTKAIALNIDKKGPEIETGDTIKSFLEKSMLDDVSEQMLPIKDKAEKLMLSLDSVMTTANNVLKDVEDVFNEKNKQNLTHIISNLNQTLIVLNGASVKMDAMIAQDLSPAAKNFKHFSDSLANTEFKSTISNANKTLTNMEQMLAKINNGEGTMGQLLNNDSLYKNLESVSLDMDKLLIDFREHPKRYVHFSLFGRKEKD